MVFRDLEFEQVTLQMFTVWTDNICCPSSNSLELQMENIIPLPLNLQPSSPFFFFTVPIIKSNCIKLDRNCVRAVVSE